MYCRQINGVLHKRDYVVLYCIQVQEVLYVHKYREYFKKNGILQKKEYRKQGQEVLYVNKYREYKFVKTNTWNAAKKNRKDCK